MSVSMQRADIQATSRPATVSFLMLQNAKKSALHAANKLSNGLASTVGDGQSRLQVSADIHQPPFVFPFFA